MSGIGFAKEPVRVWFWSFHLPGERNPMDLCVIILVQSKWNCPRRPEKRPISVSFSLFFQRASAILAYTPRDHPDPRRTNKHTAVARSATHKSSQHVKIRSPPMTPRLVVLWLFDLWLFVGLIENLNPKTEKITLCSSNTLLKPKLGLVTVLLRTLKTKSEPTLRKPTPY